MAKTAVVKASELQRASGQVLKRVAVNKEHLVVERDGYPVAVMMSYPEYEQLMRERAEVRHRDLVAKVGQEMEQQGLTEEHLLTELEATKRQVVEEKYGRAWAKK
jgi:prevent-host-death family protein